MATSLNNSTGSIRVQLLHDRLLQLNKRRRSLQKRNVDLQTKSLQLQEMAKKALSISLTDRSDDMDSPSKRPRLDTSFQRGSVARRMVRKVSHSRLQKASNPVPPETRPISHQTSSSLLQMSAVMFVSPVHELKTFIVDGVQHTPC